MLIEEELSRSLIGAAIEVHRHWGPGLYEQIYERSFCVEMKLREISFQDQLEIPLIYKGEKVGDDVRADVVVEQKIVVENKAAECLLPIHEAQLLTYMKLLKCRVGLLINYNVPVLKDGIKRLVL